MSLGEASSLESTGEAMYGDPFLSLVVALFAIVFYNHSSIPTGKSYDSQNM